MNILIIGNGFDIAHNLPTAYTDFLKVFKPDEGVSFSNTIETMKNGIPCKQYYQDLVDEHIEDIKKVDSSKIREIENVLKYNVWAKYYASSEAEINGWIDFEREMLPVFNAFRYVFDHVESVYDYEGKKYASIRISDELLRKKLILFDKYIEKNSDYKDCVRVTHNYVGITYGLYREKILSDLKSELDVFIGTFFTYLFEFVSKMEVKVDPVIASIEADAIISFNYTTTEAQYENLRTDRNYHVHGSINEADSLVMGVNKVPDDEKRDFIYFEKFFQRIRRGIGFQYRDLLEKDRKIDINKPLNIIVYGHSLDQTDEDIIKPFLEQANIITIYFYSTEDYERKVINLIKMFNRQKVEDDMYNKRIEFRRTDGKEG